MTAEAEPPIREEPAAIGQPSEVYDDGYLRVEHDNYYVACRGKVLTLPKKEFRIISRLVRNPGRIIPLKEIWRYAWGDDVEVNAASLRVHIYRLRNAFSPFGLRIESMATVGYRVSIDTSSNEDLLAQGYDD